MPLTELQLTNFKQFEDASVEFTPGMNVVVGENGEGKSNLLLAIQLATGNSDRTERCVRLAEGVRRAEIQVTMQDGDQVSRILEGGKSVFRLNSRQCRPEELPACPLVCIEQQQTDRLSALSPSELWAEFQASTSVRNYGEKKDEIRGKLEQIRSRRQEAVGLLDQYREKVRELQEDLRTYEEFSQCQRDIRAAEGALRQLEIEDLEELNLRDSGEIARLEREIARLEDALTQALGAQRESGSQAENLSVQSAALAREVSALRAAFDLLVSHGISQDDEGAWGGRQEMEMEKEKENGKSHRERLADVQRLLAQKTALLESLALEVRTASGTPGDAGAELQEKRFQLAVQEDSEAQLQGQLQESQLQLQRVSGELEATRKRLRPVGDRVRVLQGELQGLTYREERARRRRAEAQAQVAKAMGELSSFNRGVVVSGYARDLPGYLGMLGEMVSWDPSLSAVVESALGASLFAHVVDTRDNAVQLIKILQARALEHEELGRVGLTILVAEDFQADVEANPSFASQLQSQENARELSSLLQSKPEVRHIVHSLLQRALLVRSFSLAGSFSKSFHADCYTVDGDCVYSSGLVAAGHHSSQRSAAFLTYQEAKSIEHSIALEENTLAAQQKTLIQKLGEEKNIALQKEEENLQVTAQLAALQAEHAALLDKTQTLAEKLFDTQATAEQLRFQIAFLASVEAPEHPRESAAELQQRMAQTHAEIADLQARRLALQTASVPEPREYPGEVLEVLHDLQSTYGISAGPGGVPGLRGLLVQKDNALAETARLLTHAQQQEKAGAAASQEAREGLREAREALSGLREAAGLREHLILQLKKAQVGFHPQPTEGAPEAGAGQAQPGHLAQASATTGLQEQAPNRQKNQAALLQRGSDAISARDAFERSVSQPETLARPQKKAELQTKLHALKHRAARLAPNVLAYETCRVAQERLQTAENELAALGESEARIQELLRSMEERHAGELEENLQRVSQAFSEYFRALAQAEGSIERGNEQLFLRTDFGPDFAGLSGGQKATVSLAFALGLNSLDQQKILLLDEPDANLDTETRRRLAALLRAKCDAEEVQVIATSFREEIKAQADAVFMVQNGAIIPQDK